MDILFDGAYLTIGLGEFSTLTGLQTVKVRYLMEDSGATYTVNTSCRGLTFSDLDVLVRQWLLGPGEQGLSKRWSALWISQTHLGAR